MIIGEIMRTKVDSGHSMSRALGDQDLEEKVKLRGCDGMLHQDGTRNANVDSMIACH